MDVNGESERVSEAGDICRTGSHFVRGGHLLVTDDALFDKNELFQDRTACITGVSGTEGKPNSSADRSAVCC